MNINNYEYTMYIINKYKLGYAYVNFDLGFHRQICTDSFSWKTFIPTVENFPKSSLTTTKQQGKNSLSSRCLSISHSVEINFNIDASNINIINLAEKNYLSSL